VPIRATADSHGELVNQLLYGEYFKVVEQRKYFSRIRIEFDGFEGWISNAQFNLIDSDAFEKLKKQSTVYATDLVSFITIDASNLMPIVLGATVTKNEVLNFDFEGNFQAEKNCKSSLLNTVSHYLNAPFLSGGRTPFGIDASGLTQMVYKINGYALKRSTLEQSAQGEALSFIEESEPGDLAFFDNKEGIIDHVGIVLENNYIIHAHGKVRIDRLDHTGIFNSEKNQYTHSLRVIKKII
jgi:hypothetical protein